MAGLSFQEAERFIRENPKQADALAFEAQEYFKRNPEASPADLPKTILDGQAISEAYNYLREQHEDSQMRESGSIDQAKVPGELAGMPLLAVAFLQKPKVMEDDRHYLQIEESLKKEWLKNNPGKNFSSKEGVEYLYGSLEDRTKTSLHEDAEKSFRDNPKYKKGVERYDREAKKTYKSHEQDPKVLAYKLRMQGEIAARLELMEKTRDKKIKISKADLAKSQNEITQQVHRKYLREFAHNYPEKTKFYHEKIKEARTMSVEKGGARFGINFPRADTTLKIPSPTTTTSAHIPTSNRPSGGRINKGINSLNKFMQGGVKNPFGKLIGPQAAIRRGFLAFLLGPGGVVLIALVIIVSITFIIVLSGVAPVMTPSETTSASTE